MDDLLTVHQVQDLLKVDRITVYRMLHDGRIKGIKIGQQWRLTKQEVARLVGGEIPALETPLASEPSLPVHCIQTIQDLFSAVSQVSAMMVNPQGTPLTKFSSPCAFCQAVMSSRAGAEACRGSWRDAARSATGGSKFFTCHAGLEYITEPVKDHNTLVGVFLAGQFIREAADPRKESTWLARLAAACSVNYVALENAARDIKVIPGGQQTQVDAWPGSAAAAIESILRERTGYLSRLRQIADLTQIP
jgi:excisionase family DNA binding protein